LVPGSWFLVPGSWFLVPGSWFLVPGSWFLVPGSWFLVPGSWFLEAMMSEKLAELLRSSPFATVAEADNFMIWYHNNKHRSDWDEHRRNIAVEILIQADEENDPEY
jgi:hypothetical protein